MQAFRVRAVTAAVAAAVVLVTAGCAESGRDKDGGAGSGDTLVFGVAADPKVLDPSLAKDGETLRVARQMFETLVRPVPGGTQVEAGLAETFKPSPDGKVWTFGLRPGVTFHDGTALDGAAICTNFDRWFNATGVMQSPDVTGYWQDVFGGFAKNESAELPPSLYKSCAAPDAKTAVITLTRPSSKIPSALGLPSFSIHSPAAMEKYGAQASGSTDSVQYPEYAKAHPTGTGPYKFVSWDLAAKRVTFERFDGYWGEKAKIKKLVFAAIPEESARKQALRSGDIQGYDSVAPADLKPLADEGFHVLSRPAFNILYLGIDQAANPKLKDLRVRQAIAYALNRQALVDSKLPPGAEVATQFIPPTLEGWNPDVKKYPYDVNKAKALLKEAGAENLTLKYYYPTEVNRPYMPSTKDLFEIEKADLEAAGIKIQPVPLKWTPDYLAAIRTTSKHDLHMLGWTGDYGDAYNFIGTFFDRPRKDFGFTDQALFDLFTKADSEPDATKRTALYQQLNAKIMETLPAIPISHTPSALVLAKNVTGIKPNPLSSELRLFTAEFTG